MLFLHETQVGSLVVGGPGGVGMGGGREVVIDGGLAEREIAVSEERVASGVHNYSYRI